MIAYPSSTPAVPYTDSPFQMPCSSMAASQPATTAQPPPWRLFAAYATPMPVIEVNSGCSSGENSPRRTNV